MDAVLILGGLVLLTVGGELMVRGSVASACRFGVSPLLIGLTLVGFGTSTPELATSVQASLEGAPGIAIGNIVGSNIANLLLALGVAAMFAPLTVKSLALKRDGGILLAVSIAFTALAANTALTRPVGLALIIALVAYIGIAYRSERTAVLEARSAAEHRGAAVESRLAAPSVKASDVPLYLSLAVAAAGLVSILFGARLLVEGATSLAKVAGLPETVIGLSLVAVGTSLPEVFTSAFAAYRRQPELAFGNAVGSCLYNILGIGGTTAIIAPTPGPERIATIDNPVMVLATTLVLAFALSGRKIDRREGVLLLAGYAAYLFALWPQ